MTKIDEKINEQLMVVYDMISVLHNHWIRSGSVRDEKENYHIKIREHATFVYLPSVNKIAMVFPGEIKGVDHGMTYSKDGDLTFINHMNERAKNHFSEKLRDVRSELFNIRNKAMDYSTILTFEVKKNEMLKCANEILNNFSRERELLKFEKDNSIDFPGAVEIEIENRLSWEKFFVSINIENGTLQFLRKTPSGESEPLVYFYKSKNAGLPDHIGFNNADKLDDKNIILNACLFEAEAFNSLLKHKIDGLKKTVEMRSQKHEMGDSGNVFK